jgi:hypothetical protein
VTVLSTYIFPGDLPSAPPGTPTGTLIGLNDFYGYYFGTNTEVLDPSHYAGFSMLADMFFHTDASRYDNFTFSTCALTWSSPTSYVLRSMQDFLFRAALRTSNGTEVQVFPVQRTKPTLVFHSQYAYLAAASFIALLGPFCTLFRLRGWSLLGRTVSLSPLETARAFLAPLILELCDCQLTADEILKAVGPIDVKYLNGEMMVVKKTRDTEEGQSHAEGQNIILRILFHVTLILTTIETFRVEIPAVKKNLMKSQRFQQRTPLVWRARNYNDLERRKDRS